MKYKFTEKDLEDYTDFLEWVKEEQKDGYLDFEYEEYESMTLKKIIYEVKSYDPFNRASNISVWLLIKYVELEKKYEKLLKLLKERDDYDGK